MSLCITYIYEKIVDVWIFLSSSFQCFLNICNFQKYFRKHLKDLNISSEAEKQCVIAQ